MRIINRIGYSFSTCPRDPKDAGDVFRKLREEAMDISILDVESPNTYAFLFTKNYDFIVDDESELKKLLRIFPDGKFYVGFIENCTTGRVSTNNITIKRLKAMQQNNNT